MTTQEIIDYYANLLILQYSQKPKAVATIRALVNPAIMDQLPLSIQDAYDLETAEGVQLDVIGKYVGVKRSGVISDGAYVLSDSEYRYLLKLGILLNRSGCSLYDIQAILHQYFMGVLLVFEPNLMTLHYFFDSDIGSEFLAKLFVSKGLLPKPTGVQLGTVIYSNNITSFFGFRTYNYAQYNTTPFNDYDSYDMAAPWLSYARRLII